MSTTSSSECDSCDYCRYRYTFEKNQTTYSSHYYGRSGASSRHGPMYTTIKHPLIYYAEVQRPACNRRDRCDQPRKDNANCFVKAFRWYTQEREPPQKHGCQSEKCSGFATWLDTKYVEYLRESRQNQAYQLTAQETTTITPCEPCQSSQEPCTTKRFARVRSPWRKRRRSCKESGDVPEKCNNQSCEFILQPKDLTRAASDCYPTPTSGCIKSTGTVVSSNAPNLRSSGRSRSMSSVNREKSTARHIDTIPCAVQEGTNDFPCAEPPALPPPTPVKKQEQIQQVPSKIRRADVSCQCPEEKVIPVDAATQCEPKHMTSSSTEAYTTCTCFVDDDYKPPPTKVQCKKIDTPEVKPVYVPEETAPPKKQKPKAKKAHISCQCPEEEVVKVDTPCQYQPQFMCECRDPRRDTQEVKQVFGPKTMSEKPRVDRRQSTTIDKNKISICECIVKDAPPVNNVRENKVKEIPPVDNICECKVKELPPVNNVCECIVKEMITTPLPMVTKCTRPTTCVANDVAQTSDHSICLERGPPYPFFLRIVCADKLNK